jgi:hypothetical protein
MAQVLFGSRAEEALLGGRSSHGAEKAQISMAHKYT